MLLALLVFASSGRLPALTGGGEGVVPFFVLLFVLLLLLFR